MEEIYILDAVNYIFRAYYAISSMTNDEGVSTNALYGFIRSLQKLIKDFAPKHLVCVFDGPDNSSSRQKLYSDYKMHRKKAPEDLYPQIGLAYQYCELAGIPAISINGVEADDTIASIATWASKECKTKTFICTSDKDLFQLVNDDVFILNVHKNNLLVDREKVEEIYGVRPDQMLDLLAIMGDTSDNIPGLPGFGPKTAASLLQEFDTLDNLLKNADKVSGKKKQETLISEKDQALLSRKLATLDSNLEVPKEIDFYQIAKADTTALREFFQKMKFRTLLTTLDEKEEELPLTFREETTNYQTISSIDELTNLIQVLSKEKEIAIDTETTSLSFMDAELVGVGLSKKVGEAFYIPLNGEMKKDEVTSLLKPLLENPNIGFIGHNIKYDYHIFKTVGIEIAYISFDTMVASYLVNPQNRRHNLDLLALELFQKTKISIKSLLGKERKSMKEVPINEITTYCCEDVDYTYRLKLHFEKEMTTHALDELLKKVEMPLIPVLASMERSGIFLDKSRLEEMSLVLDQEISRIEEEIYEEAGEKFNLNSPKQLSEVLFDRLGFKKPARAKTEYATGAKVLEMLAEEHAVASKILEYRGLEKLRSTYVNSLPKEINERTKRIHPTFNQSVAATGRLSCQDPNLQNIPVRSKEGRKIREGFKPQKEGWLYLAADYSQIELRLLAHLSEDEALIDAFLRGEDIHAFTAASVYEVPLSEVTKEMRYAAKAVNFGILYGQSAFGLSQELHISAKEASRFIKTYFSRYPKVEAYLESCKDLARKTGVTRTLTGRRRPITEIHNKNPHIRAAAERLAVNTPLQGTAADLIKMAMIEIQKEIKSHKTQGFMVLQIHDELLFELPESELELFSSFVKQKMERVWSLRVPLTVDIEVGKNWSEC